MRVRALLLTSMFKQITVLLASLILVLAVMACNAEKETVVAEDRAAAHQPSEIPAATVAENDATIGQPAAAVIPQSVAPDTNHPSLLRVSSEEEQNAKLAPTIVDFRQFQDPQIQSVYQEASQIGARLDQMYCYCHCKENEGHKTLLTCYQTAHASGCGICLHEAHLAYMDWQAGLPVSATIAKVNQMYNGGKPPNGAAGGM